MSEPTLQQEIEAQRPATEGTLRQIAKGIPLMGHDPDGKAKIINVDENGNLNIKVQQVGTLPVIYITRLEDRPSATEVEIGQFVILIDEELPTWVSNGVNWVEVL